MSESVLRKLWLRIMKPSYLAGRDLQGNKYFEYPNANGGRPRRTVQYKQSEDMWTYIASGKRLPVQWSAWLTHTRPNAPSIEELQDDLARQRRVQMNATILEARDKEERERMAHVTQPSNLKVQVPPETEQKRKWNEEPVSVPAVPDGAPTSIRDPWAEAKKGSDEPQPWEPLVRRR